MKGLIMAKDKTEKTRFTCKACGYKAEAMRGKGNSLEQHYANHPEHQPKKSAAKTTASKGRGKSATDLIRLAVEQIKTDIEDKRELIKNVETIKAEITKLEGRQSKLEELIKEADKLPI